MKEIEINIIWMITCTVNCSLFEYNYYSSTYWLTYIFMICVNFYEFQWFDHDYVNYLVIFFKNSEFSVISDDFYWFGHGYFEYLLSYLSGLSYNLGLFHIK